jgi:2-hydroxycyclohexanecarboxyl-CoA dehydrogenase
MQLGLASGRVIVTGGAGQIGRAISTAFAREGARILVVDIDGEQADEVAGGLVGAGAAAAAGFAIDLMTESDGEQAIQRALRLWGGVDVLVNSTGWCRSGWFVEQTDRAEWKQMVDLNLLAAADCAQAALVPMQAARRGSIVFLASDAAFGAVRHGIYGGTKAGVISLARTIARQSGRYGIRSNVVSPGQIQPVEAFDSTSSVNNSEGFFQL